METLNFDTEFDKNNTRSRFVHCKEAEPRHIYRYNLTKFELREIKDESTKVICELNIQDIIDIEKENTEVQLQFAQHFFIDNKLYYLIATQTKDGLESFLYFFDPMSLQSTLKRLLFTKKLKGRFTNIFFSKKLKNGSKEDYYILTIGTLDSALYIARFSRADFIPLKSDSKEETAKLFSCALLRTDARNAITQEIIVLNNQSNTPPDIFVVSAGSNGVMDFFLLKGDADITNEPKLQFQRYDFIELPSKLPIISIQHLKSDDSDKQILLAVGQQLLKPLRNSRLLEPSMTILKLDIKSLICKDKISMKFPCGTHVIPLRSFKVWSCISDLEATRVTWSEFCTDTFKFGEKHNTFMNISTTQKVEQVYMDEKTCWILNNQELLKGSIKSSKQRKRRLSPA